MIHIDEDILVKSSLNLLDESETSKIEIHLTECTICLEKMKNISADLEFISSFDPMMNEQQYPSVRKNKSNSVWIKNVAVIFFILGVGIIGSEFIQTRQTNVVGQRLQSNSPVLSDSLFESCPNVDIW